MPARTRNEPEPVALARLLGRIDHLVGERRAARLRDAILRAALDAVGAQGGRLLEADASGAMSLTASVDCPDHVEPRREVLLPGRAGDIGRLVVHGGEEGDDADAVLALVARYGGLALWARRLHDQLEGERELGRRFASAVESLRYPVDPTESVQTVLREARALFEADAAVMVVAAGGQPQAAAHDGFDGLAPEHVDQILPQNVRHEVSAGTTHAARIAPESALGAAGYVSLAVAAVGHGASLGFLATLSRTAPPLDDRGVEALDGFAVHAAAAMTTSVLQDEVRELGAVDPGTRLFNGRYLTTRLDQEVQRARRRGSALAVAVVTSPHIAKMRRNGVQAEADALIGALADYVGARVRGMDVGARISPDEIVLILPETESIEAYSAGERLRTGAASDTRLAGVPVSVGVAVLPESGGTHELLLAHARAAAVWAQRHGGDMTFIYDQEVADRLMDEERERRAADDSQIASLAALAASVDARHERTRGHSERVAKLAERIGREMGLTGPRAAELRTAALLHDVGKIGLPDDLLAKDGWLNDTERQELRRHPEIAQRMLTGEGLERLRPWVLHQAEHLDGSGHPRGIAGDQIPLESRIISVADAFDTLVSGRPDRDAVTRDAAVEHLASHSGTRYDPMVVATLTDLVTRGHADNGTAPSEEEA